VYLSHNFIEWESIPFNKVLVTGSNQMPQLYCSRGNGKDKMMTIMCDKGIITTLNLTRVKRTKVG